MMTKKKQVKIVLSTVMIVGIISEILFIPEGFFNIGSTNLSHSYDAESLSYEDEVEWQTQLLEYAEFGLTFDEEINTFFYDEQIVKILMDGATFDTNDAGTVEVSVLRDSDGKITDFIVK